MSKEKSCEDQKNLQSFSERQLRQPRQFQIKNQISQQKSIKSPQQNSSQHLNNFFANEKINFIKKNKLNFTENKFKGQVQKLEIKTDTSIKFKPREFSKIQNFDKSLILQNFEILNEIGKGSFATVYKGINKITKEIVAIKKYNLRKIQQKYIISIKREIQILKQLQFPSIIKLHYATSDLEHITLVMENPNNKCLFTYLTQCQCYDYKKNIKIMKQILMAVQYMHQKDICHRDIKAENILFDKQMNAKLVDFGFSIYSQDFKKQNIFCGTPHYMSPQIVQRLKYSGKKTDVWSLGVLFYIIMYRKFPFQGKNEQELNRKIIKIQYDMEQEKSKEMKIIFKRIFQFDESKRCSVDDILNQSIFNDQ